MKNSIARKIIHHVSVMLVISLAVMFLGAYHTVSKVVSDGNNRYARTALDIYCKHLTEYSNNNHMPLDTGHTDEIIYSGDYICREYGADFVYLYTIDEENSSVKYIAASFLNEEMSKKAGNHMVGRIVECELTSEELALWHGEKDVANLTTNNSYGHEISTMQIVEDCNGNRIIAGVDMSYNDAIHQILRWFVIIALIIAAVFLVFGVILYLIIRMWVSAPANKISQSMQEYITDGKQSSEKLEVKGSDEFAMIASAFNSMTDDINSYVGNIRDLTLEQANRKAEVDIAAGIQRGFLPAPDADRPDCRIRAMMSPAKDVGGDLYDYIDLGNGRCLVVIADVSGKGISAAMLMSVTLTLIRQYAKMGFQPEEILRKTNDVLSESNAQTLFVTALVGIFDSNEQSFTYSNAGHNLPFVISEQVKVLDGARGTVLGLFEGEDYENETIKLNPGDMLFLYTDGVNEAINPSNEFWGEEELKKSLTEYRASGETNPVEYVYGRIINFADGAEQHDDITILTLTVKKSVTLELSYDIREFEKIKSEILALPVSRSKQINLCVAAEEIFVNICSYAFEGEIPENEKIKFSLNVSDYIEITFEDGGRPYNPLEEVYTPDDGNDDIQVGGLGRFLSTSLTDDAKYKYLDGKNILTLIRYFEEED